MSLDGTDQDLNQNQIPVIFSAPFNKFKEYFWIALKYFYQFLYYSSMYIKKMSDLENDYTDLVIMVEEECYDSKQAECTTTCIYNTRWKVVKDWSDVHGIEGVICQEFPSNKENCHAEVLFITDNVLVNKVRKRFISVRAFQKNERRIALEQKYVGSVVIRILEEKQKVLKEFDDRSAADVTFVVDGKECKGDRKYLAGISPVFNAMLYGKFAEAQQDRIELDGIDSAEIFKDFLLAVSPLRILPNPSNVAALLKLAHQYDIPFLVRNCEDHLMRCYEISNADRILLAGKYGLDSLKMRIMQHLSNVDLREILRRKSDQLREIGSEFLFNVIADRLP